MIGGPKAAGHDDPTAKKDWSEIPLGDLRLEIAALLRCQWESWEDRAAMFIYIFPRAKDLCRDAIYSLHGLENGK